MTAPTHKPDTDTREPHCPTRVARRRLYRLLWSASLLALFPVAWALRSIIVEDKLPICFFRMITGSACPLCGLTRAFAYATHGDFGLAWQSNPLWVPAAAILVALAAVLAIDGLAHTNVFGCIARLFNRYWLYLLIALLILG